MPFLPPNQQHQSTEGSGAIQIRLLLLSRLIFTTLQCNTMLQSDAWKRFTTDFYAKLVAKVCVSYQPTTARVRHSESREDNTAYMSLSLSCKLAEVFAAICAVLLQNQAQDLL